MKVTCEIHGDMVKTILARHTNESVPGETQFSTYNVKIKLHPIQFRRKHPKRCPIERVILTKHI